MTSAILDGDKINVSLSRQEALTLFEWLSRNWEKTNWENEGLFADPAETQLEQRTTFRTGKGKGGFVDEVIYQPVNSSGVRDGRQAILTRTPRSSPPPSPGFPTASAASAWRSASPNWPGPG